MKQWIKRVGQLVVAVFVIVSLGVGLTQLQATAATMGHCLPHAFHCSSQPQCTEDCQAMEYEDGVCYPSGCCGCFE